ncbi:DUF4440 domain-containing protein [Actinopolymorpha alba]|uniref:nuclear transport factor 2 family protein n=1 Tax=Actinopolymorpha alba TaxID=533267 RepID=UPI0003799DF3|nr:DUF4440 domain-containing protein [Actinopolymorpha alba]
MADKKTEPWLATEPRLVEVLEELRQREPIFHRPELGTTRPDFEAQTATDFWEVGASGRRYSREIVLATLEERYANPAGDDQWQTSDFRCREVGPDTYLLTYTLLQDQDRLTRRSTIWQRTHNGWQILYHQGTIVQ